MYIGEKRPWYDPATDINDVRTQDRENCVRLVNFFFYLQATASFLPNALDTQPAAARVLRFFQSHQKQFPATPDNCHWQFIDALLTHVVHAGPDCSPDDIAYAVSLLPAPGTAPAQFWDHAVQKSYNTVG